MNRIDKRYVNIDDVLDLFGIEDEDLYATGTIEDALYDKTLKVYELPSIERHGRWMDTGSGQECSVCGEIQYGYDSGRYYCPNCGAKMDLKANE